MAKTKYTEIYENLPQIAKILLQVFLGAFVGGVYRILRYLETNNTTTLIVGVLALIPPISVVFWILDLISEVKNNKITFLID